MHVQNHCSAHFNPLFYHVLVAVAVVLCLRSLIPHRGMLNYGRNSATAKVVGMQGECACDHCHRGSGQVERCRLRTPVELGEYD